MKRILKITAFVFVIAFILLYPVNSFAKTDTDYQNQLENYDLSSFT